MRAPAMLSDCAPSVIAVYHYRARAGFAVAPARRKEPFLTLDFKSGAAAQVDWADFGFALPAAHAGSAPS